MTNPFDIPADLDTPTSVFLKLAPLGPRFLLESVEHGERIGRFSFIGLGEGLDLRSDGHEIVANGERLVTGGSMRGLMEGLRKALASAPHPYPPTDHFPFTGGLMGAIAFDVAYRSFPPLPGPSSAAEVVLYGPPSLVIFDHLGRSAAFLHDGPEGERDALRREVITLLSRGLSHRGGRASYSAPAAGLDRDGFMTVVKTAQEHIAAGEVYQLVPSVRFSGETDLDSFDVYRGLRLLNPSPYMYYCDLGDTQLIGSSPEAMVRLENGVAELRPIAGTRPRSADPDADRRAEADLMADTKEAAEHVMLVDLARNDLGRVAVPGTIEVNPYQAIERYSHVMHLVSGVTGVLESDADAFDLFAATFPAGTVVGAPKRRALELLAEMEPVGRGFYAGTVGYFGHGGTMDQAITIRTIVMTDGGYAYQAGAGIVADSVPELEWEEVLAKGAAMRGALDIAAGGVL